jgi:hypothetical protein
MSFILFLFIQIDYNNNRKADAGIDFHRLQIIVEVGVIFEYELHLMEWVSLVHQ